jgi:hypothetical protein
MEEDAVLTLVREAGKDFPRMGVRKLLICLKPSFGTMGISMGKDAFIELLYRNFMLARRVRNKRKTTFSNHRMHKYPNLTADYTPVIPHRLRVSNITYIEGGQSWLSVAHYRCLFAQDCRMRFFPDATLIGLSCRTENGIK